MLCLQRKLDKLSDKDSEAGDDVSKQCCGSGMFIRIPNPDSYPSRISDPGSRIPKQQQKRGVKKIWCHTFSCSHKFHKIEYYFVFEMNDTKSYYSAGERCIRGILQETFGQEASQPEIRIRYSAPVGFCIPIYLSYIHLGSSVCHIPVVLSYSCLSLLRNAELFFMFL